MSEIKYINFIKYSNINSWDVKTYLNLSNIFNLKIPFVLFGSFLKKATIKKVKIVDDKEYKILGVRTYGKGVFVNRIVKGNTLKMREYQQAKVNHLFWCKVDTKNGAFGVITENLADGIGSSNMTFAEIDTKIINVDFLQLLFTCKGIMKYLDSFVTGTTNRKYIRPEQLLKEIKIPLPSLIEQERIVKAFNDKINQSNTLEREAKKLEIEIEKYKEEKLGIEKVEKQVIFRGLQIVYYKNILEWGVDKIISKTNKKSTLFDIVSISEKSDLVVDIFRGKSPKYKENTKSYILNQKCNRWNKIDLDFVKSVDEDWIKSINEKFLTKEGDILINSTGEGTIGRASYVTKDFESLLYDSHILLLRFDKTKINPEFFVEVFNSNYGQTQVNKIKSAQATKQTELGIANLNKINFPLPEINIQNTIVAIIKALREEIKEIKIKAEQNRKEAEAEFEKEIFS